MEDFQIYSVSMEYMEKELNNNRINRISLSFFLTIWDKDNTITSTSRRYKF